MTGTCALFDWIYMLWDLWRVVSFMADSLWFISSTMSSTTDDRWLFQVYEEDSGLKVNDVIEVVGILSMDPSMAEFGRDQAE